MTLKAAYDAQGKPTTEILHNGMLLGHAGSLRYGSNRFDNSNTETITTTAQFTYIRTQTMA